MGHHLFTHFQKAGLGCFWRLTVFLGMLAFAATAWCEAPAAGNILIGPGGRQARILVSPPAPLARLMAGRLADYLEQRTGVRPQLISALPKEGTEGVVFLLAQADNRAVSKLAADSALALPDMKAWREDGYALRTLAQGKTQYVLCAGKGDSGVKYAVYRLMQALETKGLTVGVPPLRLDANPFFKGRLACLGAAMSSGAPALIQKHYAWENWQLSRITALADFFDACGMNGIMSSDNPARYDWTGNHITPEQFVAKQHALARETHLNGMTFCMMMLGTSSLEARSLSELQPRDPKQRKLILDFYDDMFRKYGDITDLLWTQWADPGGAPAPADISDPQKLHLEMIKRLEAKRGKPVEQVFSAHGLHWPLGPGGSLPWAGYTGPESLTGGGILPKGICIGLPEMVIEEGGMAFARKVKAAGYRVGIFGWLMPDYEMNPGIHVHTQMMDNYFHRLPAEAKDLFDWYEDGLVYTTMSPASFYVFSRMMWDPQSSADQHLADFCQAAFGPELGPKMLKGYRAVADVRCGPGTAEERGMCRLGRGSADPVKDLKTCEAALVELEGAVADRSWLATLPLPTTAEDMIGDLRAQLTGMAKYARFRTESAQVGALIASGAAEKQIRAALVGLLKLEAWPGSTQPKTPGSWGQPEYFLYNDVVSRWEQQLQEKAAGGAPEVKGTVLFSEDFSKYPAGADGRPDWQPASDAAQGQPKPQWGTERGAMAVTIPGAGGELAKATGVLLAGKPAWGNYSVQLRLKLIRTAPGGGGVGLRVRVGGGEAPQSQAGYILRLSGQDLEFGWLSGGSFRRLQTVPVKAEPNSWHTVRLDCQGTSYKVYWDGRQLMGTEDWYGPRAGRVALEIRNAQGAFDDFTVKEIK